MNEQKTDDVPRFLEASVALFWKEEGENAPEKMRGALAREGFLVFREMPFQMNPLDFQTKEAVNMMFEHLYRDLLVRVVDRLASERLYLISVERVEFIRGEVVINTLKGAEKARLDLRVLRLEQHDPRQLREVVVLPAGVPLLEYGASFGIYDAVTKQSADPLLGIWAQREQAVKYASLRTDWILIEREPVTKEPGYQHKGPMDGVMPGTEGRE